MNKKGDIHITKFKQAMTLKMLTGVITKIGLLFIAFILFYFAGRYLCSFWVWSGDEPLYLLLKIIDRYLPSILIIVIGIILTVILISSFMKALGYLEDVLSATENIYNSKNDLIELPNELNEVEKQMNQIKINVLESQRVAREAEQRKNDLVVYLAHDLKTPLTSVIGYLTLLHDEKQISDELRDRYLSIALNKAERLEDLINEFFDITRFNLSTLTLELSRINLTRMLEQLIYEFKPMLLDKNLHCSLTAEPDIIISCDVDKMQRVFDNLLRNAVNYSFENNTIDIAITKTAENVKLSFVNHGYTIPKEKLDRIFEQFYRLDSARTTKNGGAGLGLAIAKEIVELHHGSITAESENEIITFEVLIPSL